MVLYVWLKLSMTLIVYFLWISLLNFNSALSSSWHFPTLYRPSCLSYLFHHRAVKEAVQYVSEWCHDTDWMSLWREALLSKAHCTSLCISTCLRTPWHIALWELTSNQFIFIWFCCARNRHFSDVTAPAAFPKPALYITFHLCLWLSLFHPTHSLPLYS